MLFSPWVEPRVGVVPGSTSDFPGIWRGKLRAQDGALVYEKNFLFLKRATVAVGPSRRDGMRRVWLGQNHRGRSYQGKKATQSPYPGLALEKMGVHVI